MQAQTQNDAEQCGTKNDAEHAHRPFLDEEMVDAILDFVAMSSGLQATVAAGEACSVLFCSLATTSY